MTIIGVNGLAVHVQTLGSGTDRDCAVMIHGLGWDTLASWYFTLAGPLHASGRRAIMFDLRGHGRSERPPTGYRIADFVDDLEGLLETLAVTGPVSLLGNSFGGTVAFAYAIRHPERVRSIVAIESAPATAPLLERVISRLVERRPVRERYAGTTLAEDLCGSRPVTAEEVTRITCPVLGIYGGRSRLVEGASTLRELLPHSRVVVLPEHRHTVLIDASMRIRDVVLPWLDEAEGRLTDDYIEHRAFDHHQ